jgi:glycosyltransferase involved in cell wall biosynthesis
MQENNVVISVIVPAYNAAATIIQTLKSIATQTFTHWECIIVDDGSQDDTVNVAKAFIKDDPRFQLHSIKNSGVCVARNTAVAYSTGKYLFPLDADDYIHSDCLDKCYNVFEHKPETRLVYTEGELFGAKTGLWNLPVYSYKAMLRYNMVGNSSLFLREDFDRVGGYRLNMINGLEDWDFWVAVLEPYADHQVVKINEALFYYRTSNNSRGTNVVADGRFSAMVDNIIYNNYKIYQRHYPDIFNRVLSYDFNRTVLGKKPVQMVIKSMLFLSTLKNKLFRKPS